MHYATSATAVAVLATAVACGPEAATSSFESNRARAPGEGPSGQFGGGTEGGDPAPGSGACVKDKTFYDVPGDGCDNDDDGTVDNPKPCDGSLPVAGTAEDFARAMGICETAGADGFGLVSARLTRGHGIDAAPGAEQHGILPKFGSAIKPREGARLGVLSTGHAREFNGGPAQPFTEGKSWSSTGGAPPGFPKAAQGCPQSNVVNDVVDVVLELKAPKNASGFKFDFNFFSSEWPAFVCSRFNDGFIAYLTAASYQGGRPDNISFDAKKNPVSVNNGFFDRCTAGAALGCLSETPLTTRATCPGGPGELAGTGFGLLDEICDPGQTATQGGATGWLSSTAPVKPEETFTLELIIWDTGDAELDSSVLVDNFAWLGGKVTTSTERPTGPR